MSDIFVDNVDIAQLNEQRLALVDMIIGKPDSVLWGLVHMLDDIYDRYGIHYCCAHDYESGCDCCREQCEAYV